MVYESIEIPIAPLAILLIEEDITLAERIMGCLVDEDFCVFKTDNLASAAQILDEQQIEVIIGDFSFGPQLVGTVSLLSDFAELCGTRSIVLILDTFRKSSVSTGWLEGRGMHVVYKGHGFLDEVFDILRKIAHQKTASLTSTLQNQGLMIDVNKRESHSKTVSPPEAQSQNAQTLSCFISYSHEDEEFARRLHSKMQTGGLRVWFAPEEMKGGEKLHEQIFSAIQGHDKLLLILSEKSIASEWVATEIRRARRVEREQHRRKLFPIRLVDFNRIQQWECFDADNGKDLAIELREYFIPDFSNWKDPDAFEAAFARLLKDLRAETETR